MTAREKPQHRSGYTPKDLEQVRSVCLTVAVTLGDLMNDICIVGGLVPALLIDSIRTDEREDRHPGTNDLDVALDVVLLDEERYTEISKRLRSAGFEADKDADGKLIRQRWRLGTVRVTIDFLMPPTPDQAQPGRLQNLEADFAAIVMQGLELAFADHVTVELDGHTFKGEHALRTVPVCGPAPFVILKALAWGNRAENKDAFDLVYVLRHTPGSGRAIAEKLAEHAGHHREVIESALGKLARDFREPGDIGPLRAAEFIAVDGESLENDAADALGYVDDLLRAARELGLNPAKL